MKAAILHGREKIEIEDIAPPALKPGEVRIRIEAALTCGTDLKVFKRGYHAKMIVPPAVFGHELAGVISELGAGSSERAGKWATASWWPIPRRAAAVFTAGPARKTSAKTCCSSTALTPNPSSFRPGWSKKTCCGSSRKPISAMPRWSNRSPVSCRASKTSQLRAGQNVLVIGAGPIGLMFVVLAKNLGCHVTVAGRRAARLAAAQRLGAARVVDIGDGSGLVARIREATKTHFDAVIEAVGHPAVWEAAVHLVRKGGTVNFFGGCPSGTSITLDTTLIHYSNLTLLASFHHTPRTIRRALEFIEAGLIRAADFVDGECPLSQLPELFQSMAAGNHAVKTLIRVHE